MLRKLKWQIPGESLAVRYNWCQGPVPGRGPRLRNTGLESLILKCETIRKLGHVRSSKVHSKSRFITLPWYRQPGYCIHSSFGKSVVVTNISWQWGTRSQRCGTDAHGKGPFYGSNTGFHRYVFGELPDLCSLQGFPACFMLAVATFLKL